jgi:hypothetical protein
MKPWRISANLKEKTEKFKILILLSRETNKEQEQTEIEISSEHIQNI